jgi:hypothetical protein
MRYRDYVSLPLVLLGTFVVAWVSCHIWLGITNVIGWYRGLIALLRGTPTLAGLLSVALAIIGFPLVLAVGWIVRSIASRRSRAKESRDLSR